MNTVPVVVAGEVVPKETKFKSCIITAIRCDGAHLHFKILICGPNLSV